MKEREKRRGRERDDTTERKGRGEAMCFSPAGTCNVSMCLTPEPGDVSTTAKHTYTHTESSSLPNFTHSKEWGINSMMKPNTTSTALSADSLRNSPWQCTHTTHKHTHAHTDTPPRPHLVWTNKTLFSEIREDRLTVYQCSKNKPKN